MPINPTGRYSLVLYTNPDLEDETKTIIKALDSVRAKSNFYLVRVVDLSGGVPIEVRTVVRMQIREHQDSENDRLKPLFQKAGVTKLTRSMAPVVPDFSGATIKALLFKDGASHVQAILFDKDGHESKRFDRVIDSSTLPSALSAVGI